MEQSKFVVTLASLRKNGACYEGYNKVVRMLQGRIFSEQDMERGSYIRYQHKCEISLIDITNNNGIDDALWVLRCIKGIDRDCRLFAVWCARQVQNNMNPESINLLNSVEDYANGKISLEQLNAAWDAARAAAWDAARNAAWDAAWDAARDKQKEMFIAMCNGQAPWQKEQQCISS